MNIAGIELETHVLPALKRFYTEVLGLSLVREGRRFFSVKVGQSTLKFQTTEEVDEEPFYHFAFNIPENQLDEARRWLTDRGVKLIQKDNSDLFHFKDWNADAIFFYDPAGNIVELIARHNLENARRKPFGVSSFLNISEIGVAVDNVAMFCDQLKEQFDANLWKGDRKNFAAVGDENGLFIVVPIDRPWFPVDRKAVAYPIAVDVK